MGLGLLGGPNENEEEQKKQVRMEGVQAFSCGLNHLGVGKVQVKGLFTF